MKENTTKIKLNELLLEKVSGGKDGPYVIVGDKTYICPTWGFWKS